MRLNDTMEQSPVLDFSKIKVGIKTLDDAILDLGDLKKIDPRLADKKTVLKAIHNQDLQTLRDVSNFFYRSSGIYSRVCRYMAYLYRYDWMVTPYVQASNGNIDKILTQYNKVLTYLDNFEAKKFFGDVTLKVVRDGCYYGYLIPKKDKMVIQELPVNYCRSRYSVGGRPAVEFNMKFFDTAFKSTEQKMKILNLFPNEFKKGYVLYKEGKLKAEYPGDSAGWYLLDPKSVVKFNINGDDYPLFISAIPMLIDLDAAQELDRKKMAQKLLKIIIQKMPFDKNGDLIFDVDEAQQLHNNAVKMLGKAIGIDVLTTFADVDVADLADKSTATSIDELEKVERTAYNEFGVAQNLFNTDGNVALEKSILNDEASIYNLILQYEAFLNDLLIPFNTSPKKVVFRVQILNTTIYNYEKLAKAYQEQTKLGYSKMLPQIALGQAQSSILATAHFENDLLDLASIFIPPLSSNTMSADALKEESGEKAGRKEKPDDEKSDKTLANRESMN